MRAPNGSRPNKSQASGAFGARRQRGSVVGRARIDSVTHPRVAREGRTFGRAGGAKPRDLTRVSATMLTAAIRASLCLAQRNPPKRGDVPLPRNQHELETAPSQSRSPGTDSGCVPPKDHPNKPRAKGDETTVTRRTGARGHSPLAYSHNPARDRIRLANSGYNKRKQEILTLVGIVRSILRVNSDSTDNTPSGPELVRSLAELSRVGMTEEEIVAFGGQLDAIIESVSALQEVDTEGVEPTGHAIDVTNVYREDSDRDSYTRDEMLSNAPVAQEGYVRVRYVFGEDETEP